MQLRIDPQSAVPLYAQVVEQIRELVGSGALRDGDRLPPVRELAATLRINRNTAAKAYAQLETEGLLRTRPGDGTYVADDGPRWDAAERRRRVRESARRLVHEARRLGVDDREVRDLLDDCLETTPGESAAALRSEPSLGHGGATRGDATSPEGEGR